MKIEYEGQVWQFDTEKITLQQAMAIQLHTGKSIAAWEQMLDIPENEDGTPADPGPEWLTGLQCVYWLMKNQSGEIFPIIEADFVIYEFLEAFAAGMQAEVAARKAAKAARELEEAGPDPTIPALSPPPSPEAPTSPAPPSPKATTPLRRVPDPLEAIA